MIRVRQVKININDDNRDNLVKVISKKIRVSVDEVKDIEIVKRSLDARYKPELFYIYEVDVCVDNEDGILKKNRNNNDVIVRTDNVGSASL